MRIYIRVHQRLSVANLRPSPPSQDDHKITRTPPTPRARLGDVEMATAPIRIGEKFT